MTEVVAALIWEGGRFMACQRPAHKTRGLLWEFVGGKVEPGETREAALVRECREELGVTVRVDDVFMEVVHEYPDMTVHLTLFNAAIAEGTPQKLEHNDIRWLTVGEIGQYEFCPADEEILARLRKREMSEAACGGITERLMAMSEPEYRAFQCRLMPSVDPARVLGVRTPLLRALAKQLPENEAEIFLLQLPHRYYEEDNLHGFLIERMKDFDAAVAALDAFLPYVDNWATCDSMTPKVFARHRAGLVAHIRRWLSSGDTYTVRFAIEMLMNFYLDEAFEPVYPEWVAAVESGEYYVRMMAAWYFATALAKQYDAVLPYFTEGRLEPWTHNKAIQKAVESRRITPEQKEFLRGLRRQDGKKKKMKERGNDKWPEE